MASTLLSNNFGKTLDVEVNEQVEENRPWLVIIANMLMFYRYNNG